MQPSTPHILLSPHSCGPKYQVDQLTKFTAWCEEQANITLITKRGKVVTCRARQQMRRASPSDGGCCREGRMDQLKGAHVGTGIFCRSQYEEGWTMPSVKGLHLRECQLGPWQIPRRYTHLPQQMPAREERWEEYLELNEKKKREMMKLAHN